MNHIIFIDSVSCEFHEYVLENIQYIDHYSLHNHICSMRTKQQTLIYNIKCVRDFIYCVSFIQYQQLILSYYLYQVLLDFATFLIVLTFKVSVSLTVSIFLQKYQTSCELLQRWLHRTIRNKDYRSVSTRIKARQDKQ